MAKLTKKILNIVYDVFTAIISLLDVITDLLVMYEFYVQGRMAFFYASLVILIVAQFAYCIAFWFKFEQYFDSFGHAAASFCCLLPFAPFLSFAFYFTADNSSCLYQFLVEFYSHCRCRPSINTRSNASRSGDAELEAFREWMKEKLSKHLGFIIEAMVEAFPQSILQLIAIVYFNDVDNYLAMISIFLSMLSVSSKSFILSVAASYNWKSALFMWLCAVTDFIGIFFVVSFAFYVPPDLGPHDTNPFAFISHAWLVCIACTVAPFAVIGSIGMNLYVCYKALNASLNPCMIFFVQLAWIVGLCITIMSMTIACFLLASVAVFSAGIGQRVPTPSARSFYLNIVDWYRDAHAVRINDNKDANLCIHISASQHQMIRLCSINIVLLRTISSLDTAVSRYWNSAGPDRSLLEYLHSNENPKTGKWSFHDVRCEDLKQHCTRHVEASKNKIARCKALKHACVQIATFLRAKFDKILMQEHFQWVVIAVCTPLYLLGRVFNFLFFVFIILYLTFGHRIHIFTPDVPIFQTAMFGAFLLLLCMWSIAFYLVLREQHWMSFILPSATRLAADSDAIKNEQKKQQILDYYDSLICQPFAKLCCLKIFGNDITEVIMQYYQGSNLMHSTPTLDASNETTALKSRDPGLLV
mmetsp:Transcript_58123/g.96366  ORF Transcript_58123/g.96366 Transcript_58123/m.96366 type:complete len:642 (-) Transcript_58123:108-2033(-)